MQQPEVDVEESNKNNLNPSKIDNYQVMDSNKKRYLSNKKLPMLHINYRNGDLKSKEQRNMPKFQLMGELDIPLKKIFNDALVQEIVEFTNLYGHQEKGDCSFDLSNEKFLFLGILLLSDYHELSHRRMYSETIPETFVQAMSVSISRNEFERILQKWHLLITQS